MNRCCRSVLLALALLAPLLLEGRPRPAAAALPVAQRALVDRYVTALERERYDDAFALLTDAERRYFGSAANFASIFAADRLKIRSHRVFGSASGGARGTVALVSERVAFFDPARQSPATATVKVAYGIVTSPGGARIKDPYHPWRAVAPAGIAAVANGAHIIVRKVSFFTGRMEWVITFANTGDAAITFLPYGRSVVRDDAGKAYAPIAVRLAGLTDKVLYTGLRLPAGAQYTGLIAFATPDRFAPKALTLTIAPALVDGGDAPFELNAPAFAPAS